ncbi:MAG TPA: DUF2000 family protein [Candidatus Saccharimonadales bacterium]|nr:DUF2000 family protein [Candidatus Saccharimonadales bacterium]
MHDTKIGIIVRTDLAVWQKLNVTAFLSSGIAANSPESIGEKYEDASGNTYLSIFGQPVFVYMATKEELKRTRTRALSREVPIGLYTKEMFSTGDDVENRAAVKTVRADELDIVGIALRADRKTFDKIVNGLNLHS